MDHVRRVVVNKGQTSRVRLPEWASEGTVMIEWLRQNNLLKEVIQRFRVARAGGYAGVDIVIFFLFLFASQMRIGIKTFCERANAFGTRLMAVAGRAKLPTQASISRFLSTVTHKQVRAFSLWLLLQGCDARNVLRHPSTMTRDCMGQGWHIFDWDPTVTAIRQRALPEGDDLPEPKRRSEQAQPGYSGRKRGDVQIRRCTLQHSGSGLWLLGEIFPGNSGSFESYKSSVDQVVETARYAELPEDRLVIRSDGEAGVAYLDLSQQRQVHYLTRLTHYSLLHQEDIQQHLSQANWYEVPSSGSGPRRFATDLGEVTLRTESAHAPETLCLKTRVVVSRFVAQQKRGSGVYMDGWHYELFGTDLPNQGWPCQHVVWGYYGRTGQENRFSQEDRKLELDRTYSQSLAGQEFANLMGLFVWNLRICLGFALQPPGQILPAQVRSPLQPVRFPNAKGCQQQGDPPSPTRVEESPDAVASDVQPPTVLASVAKGSQAVSDTKGCQQQGDPPSPTRVEESPDAVASDVQPPTVLASVAEGFEALAHALEPLNLAAFIGNLGPKWSLHANGVELVCPQGASLSPICLDRNKRPRLHFRIQPGQCTDCPHVIHCARTTNLSFRKQVSVRVPVEQAPEISRCLENVRQAHRQQEFERLRQKQKQQKLNQRKALAPKQAIIPGQAQNRPSPSPTLVRWQPHICAEVPLTILSASPPLLLQAKLQQRFSQACLPLEIQVDLNAPKRHRRSWWSSVIASSEADRQHRRRSWHYQSTWNVLPSRASCTVTINGASALSKLKGFESQAEKKVA